MTFKEYKSLFRYISVYQMFISFKVNGFVDILIEKACISTKPFTLYMLINRLSMRYDFYFRA